MKNFNIMHNVGGCKYLVAYHNGVKTHRDNSPFYDVILFRNKIKLNKFVNDLLSDGYIES